MKKLRLGIEFLPRKNPVFHIAVCLIIWSVSRCGGSFYLVHVCEYSDAFLMWANIPTDVINKAVYKGDILVVSWPKELGFNAGPSYKGRLMQEGERGFRIIKATQADSGTYQLMYNSPQTNESVETINLQVIVPPTKYCIPYITRQGDTLRAELPQEGCGIPLLTPKWMNSGKASILIARSQPGTYTACADGMALRCFQGNLCANFTFDGDSWETVCEFQDANLLFPNTPSSSAGDIRAKTWNKENGIHVASWMEKTNFEPNNLYGDRLVAIGENRIKIRNATRFDSGTYTLVLTSGSIQKFIEFTLHLEVLVPPTNQCIPSITQESNALRPKLNTDVCGIPMVRSEWKNIPGNISVLYFESRVMPGIYTVCANGKSIQCFKGDVDRLCLNYTVSEIQPQDQSSSIPGGIIAITVSVVLIVITIAIVLVCRKKEYIRRKLWMSTRERTIEYNPGEGNAMMGEKTSAEGV